MTVTLSTSTKVGEAGISCVYDVNARGDELLRRVVENVNLNNPGDVHLFLEVPGWPHLTHISSEDTLSDVGAGDGMFLYVLSDSEAPVLFISAILRNIVRRKEEFNVIKRIAGGGGGQVYLAMDKTNGKEVALKRVTNLDRAQVIREMNVQAMSQHRAIAGLKGVYIHDDEVGLILDYYKKGSLQGFVDRKLELTVLDKFKVMAGVAAGMCYLHAKRIIHRDLKPLNVLLDDDGTPWICDFGLSKKVEIGHSIMTESMGTAGYMSPEVIMGCEYTWSSDVFAYGMMIYSVWYRNGPFINEASVFRINSKIDHGERPALVSKEHEVEATAPLKAMIEKCWDQAPANRYSFSEIVKIFGDKQHVLSLGLPPDDYDTFAAYFSSVSVRTFQFTGEGIHFEEDIMLHAKVQDICEKIEGKVGTKLMRLFHCGKLLDGRCIASELDSANPIVVTKLNVNHHALIADEVCIEPEYVNIKVDGKVIAADAPVPDQAKACLSLPVLTKPDHIERVEVETRANVGDVMKAVSALTGFSLDDFVLFSWKRKLCSDDPLSGVTLPLEVVHTVPIKVNIKVMNSVQTIRFADTETVGDALKYISSHIANVTEKLQMELNGERLDETRGLVEFQCDTLDVVASDVFQVSMRLPNGEVHPWNVRFNRTFSYVRAELAHILGIKKESIQLTCRGQKLEDSDYVISYQGSEIVMSVDGSDVIWRRVSIGDTESSIQCASDWTVGELAKHIRLGKSGNYMNTRFMRFYLDGKRLRWSTLLSDLPDGVISLDVQRMWFNVKVSEIGVVSDWKYIEGTCLSITKDAVRNFSVPIENVAIYDSETGKVYPVSTPICEIGPSLDMEVRTGMVCVKVGMWYTTLSYSDQDTLVNLKRTLKDNVKENQGRDVNISHFEQNGRHLEDSVRVCDTSFEHDLVAVEDGWFSVRFETLSTAVIEVERPLDGPFTVCYTCGFVRDHYPGISSDISIKLGHETLADSECIDRSKSYTVVVADPERNYKFTSREGTLELRLHCMMTINSVIEVINNRDVIACRLLYQREHLESSRPLCAYRLSSAIDISGFEKLGGSPTPEEFFDPICPPSSSSLSSSSLSSSATTAEPTPVTVTSPTAGSTKDLAHSSNTRLVDRHAPSGKRLSASLGRRPKPISPPPAPADHEIQFDFIIGGGGRAERMRFAVNLPKSSTIRDVASLLAPRLSTSADQLIFIHGDDILCEDCEISILVIVTHTLHIRFVEDIQ